MTTHDSSRGGRRLGIVPALRARLFGERDSVAEQLRDIERQGSGIAMIAHTASFLLIVLFSLGSLVAFAGTPLRQLQDDWTYGRVNIPATVSMGVSLLMVVAMDVGIVYAALRLRLLATRRAHAGELWLHVAVIAGVALTEAATYTYMSWLYDRPDNLAAWAIIVGRGVAAPLLGVYLSLARALPVGPRDVLYQVEFGAGAGLIRDVTALAHDPDASLERKALLYAAAAAISSQEADRLQRVISALGGLGLQQLDTLDFDQATHETGARSLRPHSHQGHPSNDGHLGHFAGLSSGRPSHHPSPPRAAVMLRQWRARTAGKEQRMSRVTVGPDLRADAQAEASGWGSNVRTPLEAVAPMSMTGQLRAVRRSDTGMSQEVKLELGALREAAGRDILAGDPDIGVRDFTRSIERATGRPMSESTAQALLRRLRSEPPPAAGSQASVLPAPLADSRE